MNSAKPFILYSRQLFFIAGLYLELVQVRKAILRSVSSTLINAMILFVFQTCIGSQFDSRSLSNISGAVLHTQFIISEILLSINVTYAQCSELRREGSQSFLCLREDCSIAENMYGIQSFFNSRDSYESSNLSNEESKLWISLLAPVGSYASFEL